MSSDEEEVKKKKLLPTFWDARAELKKFMRVPTLNAISNLPNTQMDMLRMKCSRRERWAMAPGDQKDDTKEREKRKKIRKYVDYTFRRLVEQNDEDDDIKFFGWFDEDVHPTLPSGFVMNTGLCPDGFPMHSVYAVFVLDRHYLAEFADPSAESARRVQVWGDPRLTGIPLRDIRKAVAHGRTLVSFEKVGYNFLAEFETAEIARKIVMKNTFVKRHGRIRLNLSLATKKYFFSGMFTGSEITNPRGPFARMYRKFHIIPDDRVDSRGVNWLISSRATYVTDMSATSDPARQLSRLVYNPRLRMAMNVMHLVDQAIGRIKVFTEMPEDMVPGQLETALRHSIATVSNNYRAAVPQYFRDHNQVHGQLQLLFPGQLQLKKTEPPSLFAFCVSLQELPAGGSRYWASTIIPMKWAFENARLLGKIDQPWLLDSPVELLEPPSPTHPLEPRSPTPPTERKRFERPSTTERKRFERPSTTERKILLPDHQCLGEACTDLSAPLCKFFGGCSWNEKNACKFCHRPVIPCTCDMSLDDEECEGTHCKFGKNCPINSGDDCPLCHTADAPSHPPSHHPW